ncbi:MAG: hypothetical protein JWN99_2508 [Ilumatobacteraceae bacterium]|nr:hypothetical protein [Ilumatobacteraceae bacterium]
MTAVTFDVGNNVVQIVLLLTTLGTLIANNRKSNRAANAAESAASQLTNNGGSTALDKLQAGQAQVLDEIAEMRIVVDAHTTQLSQLTSESPGG